MGKESKCSFCGRKREEVDILIAGATGHICNDCVVQANDIANQELFNTAKEKIDSFKLLIPSEIKEHLDEYIIGQADAKKHVAVAVYNHYKRLKQDLSQDDIEIEKSNLVLVGKTGTGKTLIAKTIAKMLDVPFAIADATVITEAGYVGEDVESILSKLLQAADYDVDAAERGIIFVDELDKIARKSDNPSITRDVSGEGVQQALLKLLEGTVVNVPPQGGRKHPDQKMVKVNTKNILFIAGGAFSGIEKIIERRVNTLSLGFNKTDSKVQDANQDDILQYISHADLKSFGLIPELIGRFPVLTHLDSLDKAALLRILTEPKNAIIKQYIRLFEMDGVKLSFTKEALEFIVDKTDDLKLGARGLDQCARPYSPMPCLKYLLKKIRFLSLL